MTALDARRLAQLDAYRNGGRNVGDNADTRVIGGPYTGQHAAIDMPDPAAAAPVPPWRHAARRPSPWAPAVVLAVAVLLLALLVVAVTW